MKFVGFEMGKTLYIFRSGRLERKDNTLPLPITDYRVFKQTPYTLTFLQSLRFLCRFLLSEEIPKFRNNDN
jgi:hypothetical protein